MNMQKRQTVRFWIYWGNSQVKLALRADEEIAIHHSGPTEEGWFSHTETYRYDAASEVVVSTILDDGSDCDGRLSRTWKGYCEVDQLAVVPMFDEDLNENGLLRPDWKETSRFQRDYAAELAGY